ncbi:S41 family peptidase [Alteromonas gilva]|uniref:Tricorn protease homolog n=1 Tax=Alteromonas gilva TaxID=2987522 RepID=A0ABT5KZ39_9ALTE|nr:S41 family peptidase [Alteromonas gilva]MDC8829526.1 S41 family peptidase [Alteromonas gilva]
MNLKGFRLSVALGLAVMTLPLTATATQLLRQPALHNDTLVFTYANDIWKTTTDGGEALRLTSFQGSESQPVISPDGKMIAFTGEYEGNKDVFVVGIDGGEPRRLTYHPGGDAAIGWSPDSKQVLFSSARFSAPRNWQQLFTVSVDGGNPTQLPMQRAFDGDFDSTGENVVFRRAGFWDRGWRNYRGGQNQALRVINLTTLKEYDLPFDNDFDVDPEWSDNGDIYFLSNRSKVTNVFKYSHTTQSVSAVTDHDQYDVMGFAVDGNNVVYEYLGDLYLKEGEKPAQKLAIEITGDFYWAREEYVEAHEHITSFNVSPQGKRAVFAARGDVFTVPVEHGSARALTDTSGAREHAPAWSAGGQHIAWFSDASGEYQLIIADQYGNTEQTIALAGKGFYDELVWSPDGKRLMFTDSAQQLWVANRDNGSTKIIDANKRVHPEWHMMASWSPDSRFIAYTTQNATMFRVLHLYSVAERKSYQLTDGLAEVRWPAWSDDSSKLYFLGSVNYGPKSAWLDMSTIAFNPTAQLYYATLNPAEDPLFELRSDEEAPPQDKPEDDTEKDDSANENAPQTVVVTEGFRERIMPVASNDGQFSHLTGGKNGNLFFLSQYTSDSGESQTSLMKFDAEEREITKLADKVSDFRLSADKNSILLQSGKTYRLINAEQGSGKDDKTLQLALSKRVNYAEEWQQIFREAWRYQRDYLYVDNFHGADWDAVYKVYQPMVASVSHPLDLTYLLDTLGGEVAIGHSYTSSGDKPDTGKSHVGLLGVDYVTDEKGVKLTHIYTGESFFADANSMSPLGKYAAQIGSDAYLLAVNGKPVNPEQNLFAQLEGTLGKVTTVTIGNPDNAGAAEDYLVKPIGNENALRKHHWVEKNRRYVEEKSGGKVAYVWVPNTAEEGYHSFNRYFYPQADKPGVIIDERFNHGGFIADYIINVLRRELNGFFNNPFSPQQPMTSPAAGVWGSKVMLINEVSGSGGDMLPYMFNYYGLGKLVGKRTWGGLVGIWGVPAFIDGGSMTAPRSGFYDVDGKWQVENYGVAPDINVEQWTIKTSQGQDPQLDKAIEVALDELKGYKSPIKPQPDAPVRVPVSN